MKLEICVVFQIYHDKTIITLKSYLNVHCIFCFVGSYIWGSAGAYGVPLWSWIQHNDVHLWQNVQKRSLTGIINYWNCHISDMSSLLNHTNWQGQHFLEKSFQNYFGLVYKKRILSQDQTLLWQGVLGLGFGLFRFWTVFKSDNITHLSFICTWFFSWWDSASPPQFFF